MNLTMIRIPIDWELCEELVGVGAPDGPAYQGGPRTFERLFDNRLVGIAGEYALAVWMQELEAWVQLEREIQFGETSGDIDSDLPGYRVDVKACRKSALLETRRHRLFVNHRHLRPDFAYVLAVIDGDLAHLTGWASDEDLRESFDKLTQDGQLVHYVQGWQLRELPPASEARAAWSIAS